MKYYKALLFGSIGSIVETSEIQRKSFNKAFKQHGLKWNWTKREYLSLLTKSGGKDRISRYAKKNKEIVNSTYLRNLKTKIFNNYLKKNQLKLRPGVKNLILFCKKEKIKLAFVSSTSSNNFIPNGKVRNFINSTKSSADFLILSASTFTSFDI